MGKIFLVLAIGFFIGYKGFLSKRGIRINGKLQTLWLLLLIFCMGVSIGRNGDIIRNLPLLGGKAMLFAALTIAGSIALVYFFSAVFLEKGAKK